MAKSITHIVGKDRPPRVHITYEVTTNGALEKVELPFLVGVLADLSGMPREPLRPLRDRNFVPIDRITFADVMKQQAPRVAFKVPNRLTNEEGNIGVELNFNDMTDFEPDKVAEQVPALKELLDMRRRLVALQSRLEGNDKLERLLGEVLNQTEAKLSQGTVPPATETPK